MSRSINRQPLWPKIKPYVAVFDPALGFTLLCIMLFALVVQFSAAYDFEGRMADHLRNFLIAFMVMWLIANLKPQFMMRIAPPLYLVGVSVRGSGHGDDRLLALAEPYLRWLAPGRDTDDDFAWV